MDRDTDRDGPERGPEMTVERPTKRRDAREEPLPSREHMVFRERGSLYRLSPAEATMHDIGRFRTIAMEDLTRHCYRGQAALMQQDLRSLAAQGLVQSRTVWSGPRSQPLKVVVLTRVGKEVLERHGRREDGQAIYARFVKPNEVRHDAAIYRMFQAERQKVERAGGRIRRVILDYELKRRVYAPLAKAKALCPAEYATRQKEVAAQNGLKVIDGRIPLPDLRVEYETGSGELTRVDLELATSHYHGPALQAKAEAGFKFYAADGSGARLTRVLEERDLTIAILSL